VRQVTHYGIAQHLFLLEEDVVLGRLPNAEPSAAPLAAVESGTSIGRTSRQQSASRRRRDVKRPWQATCRIAGTYERRSDKQAAALCRVDRAQVRDAPAASAARLGSGAVY
jgi:hypothetical protein